MLERIKTGPKIPEMVTGSLLRSIFENKLKIGEELPSEKDLCELLGVSRGSLREGLAIMEFMGIIESEKKKRIIVRDQFRAEKILSLLKLSDKSELIYDFIEFRKAVETFSVELAISRGAAEELEGIENALIELEKQPDTFFVEANQKFHITIAKATHNPLLVLIEELLMHILDSFRKRVESSPERKKQVITEHRKIYEAIREKDVSLAKNRVLEHLARVEESIEVSGLVMPNVPKKAE